MPAGATTRSRELPCTIEVPAVFYEDGSIRRAPFTSAAKAGKQMTVSNGNRFDRQLGHYASGGGFYTSRVNRFIKPAHVTDIARGTGSGEPDRFYTGPIFGNDVTSSELAAVGYQNAVENYGAKNESSMTALGAKAVSLSNPINPASNLGTSLAETFREGVPSLPGILAWKGRTNLARSAGSEYLNYQFGWAPLVNEVHDVVHAARFHRDIMNQYHHGEGRDTHRRFDFPLQRTSGVSSGSPEYPILTLESGFVPLDAPTPQREVSLVRETKTWFEGCFTYALPSSTDSWRSAIGFGSNADQLFGLALTPDLLWELTPWSWAVDWFSNAGDVINNVTNFGLAGLVMRYGYIMEESIERVTVTGYPCEFLKRTNKGTKFGKKYERLKSAPWSRGVESVTKRRVPANPFGFGIGWQGLSPTQLAITAALGITRLL